MALNLRDTRWIESALVMPPNRPGAWYVVKYSDRLGRDVPVHLRDSYTPWTGSQGNAVTLAARLTRRTTKLHSPRQVPPRG